MAPDTVEALNPVTRERLHAMVEIDAHLRPSLMPVVPPHQPGMSSAEGAHRIAVSKWRDALADFIFPDEPEV